MSLLEESKVDASWTFSQAETFYQVLMFFQGTYNYWVWTPSNNAPNNWGGTQYTNTQDPIPTHLQCVFYRKL